VSPNREPAQAREIVDALRLGAVPGTGSSCSPSGSIASRSHRRGARLGRGGPRNRFKAVRGDYGTGKTFFARWLEHRARQRGFATTLVQISETDTPLYRLQTVYRRAIEGSRPRSGPGRVPSPHRSLVLQPRRGGPRGARWRKRRRRGEPAVGELLEQRLADVSATQPQFAAALRRCHAARLSARSTRSGGPDRLADGAAQRRATSSGRRLKGDVDHDGASGFLRGLLELLKQTGRKGWCSCSTRSRPSSASGPTAERRASTPSDSSSTTCTSAGRYPGLYVLVTGTPQFFDGPAGRPTRSRPWPSGSRPSSARTRSSTARARRRSDSAVLLERLVEVGAGPRPLPLRARRPHRRDGRRCDLLERLARGVAGKLGGKVGIAPRLYLKRS
jgi:hypothetical protein